MNRKGKGKEMKDPNPNPRSDPQGKRKKRDERRYLSGPRHHCATAGSPEVVDDRAGSPARDRLHDAPHTTRRSSERVSTGPKGHHRGAARRRRARLRPHACTDEWRQGGAAISVRPPARLRLERRGARAEGEIERKKRLGPLRMARRCRPPPPVSNRRGPGQPAAAVFARREKG